MSNNIDELLAQAKRGELLTERQIKKICEQAREILSMEPNIVQLSSPVTVLI
jgi:hypothetical protein